MKETVLLNGNEVEIEVKNGKMFYAAEELQILEDDENHYVAEDNHGVWMTFEKAHLVDFLFK